MLCKSILWSSINKKTDIKFKTIFLQKSSKINWEYYESYDNTNIIYQVQSKSLQAILQCYESFLLYINSILLLIIYCFFLSKINLFVALAYLIVVVAFNLYSKKIMIRLGNIWSEIDVLSKKQQYFLSIGYGKIRHQEYVINNLHEHFYKKWENNYDIENIKRIEIHKKSEILNRISRIVLYAPYIVMMFFVAYQIVKGNYEIGFMILCMDMFNELINTIGGINRNYTNSIISSKYIDHYLDFNRFDEIVIREYQCSNDFSISLNNVSYTYPQAKKKAIDNITLKIAHGEKLAILGENGSGKTTLVNIISGLINLKNGTMQIHALNNSNINKNLVSVVYQDFLHYQMSIKDNIQCGNPDCILSDEKIHELLDKVNLKEHVDTLSDGIYTKLGQLYKGTDLSKGQWQKIAIARLLANENAEIWILDEPTAYLDPMAEVDLYNTINSLAGARTVIYISHRLGYAKNSDNIIILENGKIIESGTHNNLISKDSRYSLLYNEQVKYMFGS